jgi:hypothetical protein
MSAALLLAAGETERDGRQVVIDISEIGAESDLRASWCGVRSATSDASPQPCRPIELFDLDDDLLCLHTCPSF